MLADIGVIGLAVMGQNLILNLNDHGYKVLAHNRTEQKLLTFSRALHAAPTFGVL
jgi:6-phosphogluconate dehydrogenase